MEVGARWAERFAGQQIDVAVEVCTGWLFVCDALVADGRLPESWIPPEHVRQWRSRARLRHTLVDERTQWMQRIQATLFHHGIGGTPEKLRTDDGRAFFERLELPADARERIEIALAMIDAIDAQMAPLERELRQLARRQTGCRALMGLNGMDMSSQRVAAASQIQQRDRLESGVGGRLLLVTGGSAGDPWPHSSPSAHRSARTLSRVSDRQWFGPRARGDSAAP
jgi:hypothetical protein